MSVDPAKKDPAARAAAAPPAAEPLRTDLDAGLRFVHVMTMQTKVDLFDAQVQLASLIEELVAKGAINLRGLEERREKAREAELERLRAQANVMISDAVDKYALKDLPDIDCPSLTPKCKARCCKLIFALSFQDLDERVVQWDYSRPYQIRKRADQYCVHNQEQAGGCTVYERRPAICRTYDCRKDKRIWLDFEQRIPAPDEAILATSAAPAPAAASAPAKR